MGTGRLTASARPASSRVTRNGRSKVAESTASRSLNSSRRRKASSETGGLPSHQRQVGTSGTKSGGTRLSIRCVPAPVTFSRIRSNWTGMPSGVW